MIRRNRGQINNDDTTNIDGGDASNGDDDDVESRISFFSRIIAMILAMLRKRMSYFLGYSTKAKTITILLLIVVVATICGLLAAHAHSQYGRYQSLKREQEKRQLPLLSSQSADNYYADGENNKNISVGGSRDHDVHEQPQLKQEQRKRLPPSSSSSSSSSPQAADNNAKQQQQQQHENKQHTEGSSSSSSSTCVQSLLQNENAILANSSLSDKSISFQILLHPITKDKYITRKILQNGVYEPDMEKFIARALPLFPTTLSNYNDTSVALFKSTSTTTTTVTSTTTTVQQLLRTNKNQNDEDNDDSGSTKKIIWAVDIGANVGFHSMHMASRGATTISFEPAPDTAALIKCSATQLILDGGDGRRGGNGGNGGTIHVIEVGASDIETKGKLSRHPSSPGMTTFLESNSTSFPLVELKDDSSNDTHGNANNSTLLANKSSLSSSSSNTGGMIRLLRVENVLAEHGVPEGRSDALRLLKVDVEGYELRAFRGVNLTRFPFRYLTFEFFPEMIRSSSSSGNDDDNDDAADLLMLVRDAGYICDYEKVVKGNTREMLNEWIARIRGHVNIFCELE